MRKYGIICRPSVFLFTEDLQEVTDEILMGWAVEILDEELSVRERNYVRVLTHYGYEGYVDRAALKVVSEEELRFRDKSDSLWVIRSAFADILEKPDVCSRIQKTLGRGSFVTKTAEGENGYFQVKTDEGISGYLPKIHMFRRRDRDEYLYTDCREDYFLNQTPIKYGSEEAFRKSVTDCALSFLGTQYRWGGKSSAGLDCSGLTFLCYQMNGILIYRDARLMPQYPIQPVDPRQMKKGDLLYFPGHIAMYLGKGRYIHCTGHRESFGCVCNSLNPEDADYREDLASSILYVGSIFV